MNEQLLSDLTANSWNDPNVPITRDDIALTLSPDSGERPSYNVAIVKDGQWITQLAETGTPLKWVPDYASSKLALSKAVEKQNKVEQARTERRMNAVR